MKMDAMAFGLVKVYKDFPCNHSKCCGENSYKQTHHDVMLLIIHVYQKLLLHTLWMHSPFLSACIVEQSSVIQAELISVDGGKARKFDVKAEGDANALGKRISEASLQVWQ